MYNTCTLNLMLKGFHMNKGSIMFVLLSVLMFSSPSFADTTIFYMPVTAQVSSDCGSSYACADVEIDHNTGAVGVQSSMFTAFKFDTINEDGTDNSHYFAGVHAKYRFVDGFTPFVGVGIASGFDNHDQRYQIDSGNITGLLNFGFEAPINRHFGLRFMHIKSVSTNMGVYAKFW